MGDEGDDETTTSTTTGETSTPSFRFGTESSAAPFRGLTVGLIVGGAVAAGAFAVILGLILSRTTSTAAAPVTAAPMAAANTSPLYEANTLSFNNPLHGN